MDASQLGSKPFPLSREDAVPVGRLTEESRPTDSPASPVDGDASRDLDLLRLYLSEARRHRRLTEGEERECCRRMREARSVITHTDPPDPEAQATLLSCRQQLVRGHLYLAVAIARRHDHMNLPLEDLIQEANVGLLQAADDFDPARGTRFAAYAAPWVLQRVCRALSQKGRMIRIPLEVLDLRRNAAKVASEVEQRCRNETCCDGRKCTHRIEDDARELGVPEEILRNTVRLVPEVVSYDTPTDADADPLLPLLADDMAADPSEVAAASEQARRLRGAISDLPPRLRGILARKFGLDGKGSASLAEVGREMHLSAERVRKLQNRAFQLVRDQFDRSAAGARRRVSGTSIPHPPPPPDGRCRPAPTVGGVGQENAGLPLGAASVSPR